MPNSPPWWINTSIVVGVVLLTAIVALSYLTLQTTQETQRLARATVEQMDSMNDFWRRLEAEQRARNDSLRLRADSLRRQQQPER